MLHFLDRWRIHGFYFLRQNKYVIFLAICLVLSLNMISISTKLARTLLQSPSSYLEDGSHSLSWTLKQPYAPQVLNNVSKSLHHPVCTNNQYAAALDASLTDISLRMDAWLSRLPEHRVLADTRDMNLHNHARFSFFSPMARCNERSCVGGSCGSDVSKIVCGLEQVAKQQKRSDSECVIYSIGCNDWWEFELDVLDKTDCQIHTFDCTGDVSRFHVPKNKRLHFHHVCLGTHHEEAPPSCAELEKCGETWTLEEIQSKLQHKRIDLFKMDIEGFEWDLLESWPELDDQLHGQDYGDKKVVLPMQVLVEVHYQTQFSQIRPRNVGVFGDFKHPLDVVDLQAHLLRMGYIVVERDDNRWCKHCTELTLIRSRCPDRQGISSELAHELS